MEKLPVELHLQIIKDLDTSSIVQLSKTCKGLHRITSIDDIWKTIYDDFSTLRNGKHNYQNRYSGWSIVKKRMQMNKYAKLPYKKRMQIILGQIMCTKCKAITLRGSKPGNALNQTFKKSWCKDCWKSVVITQTNAVKELQYCGLTGSAARKRLDTLQSVKCSLNCYPGTFYLATQIDELLEKVESEISK